MVLHVTLLGKSTRSPLTRHDLLTKLRRSSPRGYHATRSYHWTEDSLFTGLSPVPLSVFNASGCCYYALKADLSCGGNPEDVRVAVMLLMDLTAAVENLIALATEKDDAASHEAEEDNVLLIELADVWEQSEEVRRAYLERWGVEEHNYHQTMVRRVMLAAGDVYVLPLSLQPTLLTQGQELEPQLQFLALDAGGRRRCREEAATEALHLWASEVERVMREESCHLAIAAVPASVAELVDAHPQLVRAALLHHTIQQPFSCLAVEAQSSPTRSEEILYDVIQEYRVLVRNKHYVRMPLSMSRYSFAHLFCASLPRILVEKPLSQTQTLSSSFSHAGGSSEEVEADERELLLGLQLTVALHRLRCEVNGQHAVIIEQFLKDLQCSNELRATRSGGEDSSVSFQRRLDYIRRKVMPVASLRGDSVEWMRSYAQEAAMAYNVTEKGFARLEEAMLGNRESDTVSESSDAAEDSDGALFNSDDEVAAGVSRQLEEVDSFLEARMRQAVLGGCDVEEAALDRVADNALFLETVQMLAQGEVALK
ncbi:uncharacterized protein Tco025E_06294 [Trypanosoma conorhini]|uniref:Uncharacterized protein n=1 Tax=Trypanosoma conorhini TaxID=83891 RepID=A0A3R7MDC7_9TRYP|nr:uncharacterized protein Tco025E_06294 [Trypanosoma conorhini]RNF13199.1 hypothetical protein Tco025E_06294 [Trypanosoma conorhini]